MFDSTVGQFTVCSLLMRLQLVLYTCHAGFGKKLTLKRVYAFVVCECGCAHVYVYVCGFWIIMCICVYF